MIELRTLGSVELRCSDGSDFQSLLAHHKPLALFAYLAVNARRGFQSRDHLARLLWSDADREHGRASVRAALRTVRQCLGDKALISGGEDRVGVNPERVRCDAVEFEDAIDSDLLDQALALYRGDLLQALSVPGANEFNVWLEGERARLRALANRVERVLGERATRAQNTQVDDERRPDITAPAIAGYIIERELGRGGAAVVYLARDTKHGRSVAIKVLKPEFTGSVQEQRFAREIDHVARFSHPHIVPLLDSGKVGDARWYVTPYISGESLRHRLEREKQLEVTDAIRVVCEVAEGLDYAHRLGVVHRDIKPENILLADGHAQIADFGLALVTSGTRSGKLTDSGIAVGTPHYVSPEQGAGAGDVDGRSDVYSLGCVLYELLAGSPPFTGVTPQQIVAQHMTAPVPPLRFRRPGIAPGLERSVLKALSKTPADRFRTASAFSEACSQNGTRAWWSRVGQFAGEVLRTRAGLATASVVLLTAMTAWALTRDDAVDGGSNGGSVAKAIPAGSARGPDTSRYAIVGDANTRTQESLADVTQLVYDALRRWRGITPVSPYEVRDALLRTQPAVPGAARARSAAMALNAGRYLRLTVGRHGDSLGVRATIVDTRTDSAMSDALVKLELSLRGASPVLSLLADSLLFHDGLPANRVEPRVGTRSFRARQAYIRGHAAIEDWNLARADREFFIGTREDPEYAQAFLWLAQVRSWIGKPTVDWQFAVERAIANRDRLTEREQVLTRALQSLARGELGRACPLWARLAAADSTDYAAWFAWGNCLRSDDRVVADARSPSGRRFRTSYHTALLAYRRAFHLHPAIHRSFAGGSLDDIRRLLITGSNAVRQGQGVPPDTTRYSSYPSWQGDTLAFIPVPARQFKSLEASSSESRNIAIRRQREQFYEIATMWRAALPQSVDAIEAVGVALDLLGNASALDTVRIARARAEDLDDRVRLAGLNVWMLVKFSTPSNQRGLREAARLADSLLASHRPLDAREARQFAGMAALLGKASQAAKYARSAATLAVPPDRPVPTAIAETAPALLAFAALGGPTDSLRRLELLVAHSIESDIDTAVRDEVRSAWLFRSATLAIPQYQSPSIAAIARTSSTHGQLVAAWKSGDLARAHQLLRGVREYRKRASIRPPDVTLDGLYSEAAVMAALGDAQAAIESLGPTLDSLAFVGLHTLTDVARAGALVRAMALRAELAHRTNDRASARAWARAVARLWAKPDQFLRPTLARMRTLSR